MHLQVIVRFKIGKSILVVTYGSAVICLKCFACNVIPGDSEKLSSPNKSERTSCFAGFLSQ